MNGENEKPKPRGFPGLLSTMRTKGAIERMPGGWAKVFLALYSYRNEAGFAWPSQSTLAKTAGVDERTVRRFIRWAKVALGVTVKKGRYSSYYLPFNADVELWAQAMPGRRKRRSIRTAQHPRRTGGRFDPKKP